MEVLFRVMNSLFFKLILYHGAVDKPRKLKLVYVMLASDKAR